MAEITLTGPKLPFVLGGTAELTVRAGAAPLDQPLPPLVDVVFDIATDASARRPLALGGPGSWTLSIKSAGGMKIVAVWPTSAAAVKQYGLASYFSRHPNDVVLLFTVGTSAEATVAGRLRYAVLTATADLEAGGDLTFAYARAYPRETPLGQLVEHLLGHVRLPAGLNRTADSGEIIRFEYGGYLTFGAGLGVGYEVKGTSSAAIGELQLSEHYGLSVVGKLGITGRVAGFFGIEIREALDVDGRPIAGWTRVVVRKTRASALTFAADVSATVTSELKGLPEAPHEFLGAVLGVNVKNWLNLLDQVRDFSDLDQLVTQCDELAVDFLTTWIGKRLEPDSLTELLAAASAFAKKYNGIETAVITAFDRHFDAITNPSAGRHVVDALERLTGLPSWESLEGEISPVLWKLTTELTDGDPLGWIAEKGIAELQDRAAALLALGKEAAHADIRALIQLVKGRFGLDPLFAELAKIQTVADLKAQAGKRLDGLVQRLLGDDIKRLQNTELGHTIAGLHKVLESVDAFERAAYAKFTDAAKQAYAFNLHAEYSRASTDQALIDIAIDTSRPEGVSLLHAAALGDFREALSSFQPELVRLNTGRLTHDLVRKSTLKINVVGWHAGWRYQGMAQLILHTDQQIISDRGSLTVHTRIDLKKDRERKRNQERVATNFMMRFLGESRGIIDSGAANLEYLIETLTGITARYDLDFEDDKTTLKELAYYLSFAKNFDLTDAGLQPEALAALLPLQGANDFGPMKVSYDVRYQSAGLKQLFAGTIDEAAIRRTTREVILSSYLRAGGNLARLGWAYWTPATRTFFEDSGTKSFASMSPKEFSIDPSPFAEMAAPARVVLQGAQLEILNTLYLVENAFVRAFLALDRLIRSGRKISPREFEDRLGDVGIALQLLDRFGESVNTTFAVVDSLLKDAGAGRASSLRIESLVAGHEVTKVFLARSVRL